MRHRLAVLCAPLTILSIIAYSFATFGAAKGLAFILVPWWLCSILFVMVTQVSHIQPEVQQADGGARVGSACGARFSPLPHHH